MKRFLFTFLILFSSLCLFAQIKLKAGIVAFYNMENLFDTIDAEGVIDEEFTPGGAKDWNEKRYIEKIDRLAMVISSIGADEGIAGGPAVIGLSEIENSNVLRDLVSHPRLRMSGYDFVHFDSPDIRGIDVALLYQTGFFEITGSASYALPLFEEDGERVFTRDQLLVSGIFDGDEIHFIINHWPSRRGGEEASQPKRIEAAKLSRSITDSILVKKPDAKVIIMGDFNDDPVNESLTEILRAADNVDQLKEGDLFNCMYPLFKKGYGSLAYNGKWNLFDQIIITQALIGENYASYTYYVARVYNKSFLTEQSGDYMGYPYRTYAGNKYLGGYSDHLPVYMVLVKEAD